MGWTESFKRWWKSEPAPNDGAKGPVPELLPGDWVVIPFRIMEALRVSLATVGAHPDLPEHIRVWIAEWMLSYNRTLASYMSEVYGPDVFPVLDSITDMVRNYTDDHYQQQSDEELQEFFKFVEKELKSDGGEKPSDSPPTS